jgi:hypothetical protein
MPSMTIACTTPVPYTRSVSYGLYFLLLCHLEVPFPGGGRAL